MKLSRIAFWVLLVLLVSNVFAQGSPPPGGQHLFSDGLFQMQTYNFNRPGQTDSSCVYFYFSLVNDILTFVKERDDRYVARYDLSVVIYQDEKIALTEKSTRDTVVVSQFEETNSRLNRIYHKLEFDLAPGTYRTAIRLFDIESNKGLERERQVTFRPFNGDRLHASDLIFADRIDCTQGDPLRELIPNLRNAFDSRMYDFLAFFTIYPPPSADSVSVVAQVVDRKKRVITIKRIERPAGIPALAQCLDVKKDITAPGEYTLEIEISAGKQSVRLQKSFSVYWGDLEFKTAPDQMIEQVKLIAPREWEKKIDQAADADEKKALIDRFWQQRDPTPDTSVNELKTEFFRRVDFANRHFAEIQAGRQGWETDRGHVYIKNGPPTDVEKHPTEWGMPSAEIWYYAHLNQRYIFSDRNGSGQFRLVKIE